MRLRPRPPVYWIERLRRQPISLPVALGVFVLGAGASLQQTKYEDLDGDHVVLAAGTACVLSWVAAAFAVRLRPAEPAPAAPPPMPAALHGIRLPQGAGHLLGRDKELAQLLDFFDECRLVTIAGPGGSGKTALALEAADVLAPGFDATRFVDLQAVPEDADELADDVARVLNLPEASSPERLAALIGEAKVLLVVDNCEHLLPPVQRLVSVLLDQCPAVVVLCTSRQPLALGHEQVLPLHPLALPPTDDRVAARATAAVELFTAQARRRAPHFTIDDDDTLDAVVRICRRLDGLPLGIVVAASLVGRRSLADVERGLEQCLNWVTPQQTGRGDQQRTLRATVEWSVGLLGQQAREVYSRVSVFAGSFALDAVRAVAPGSDVEDAVDALVDHSLVVADVTATGTRYRMLEVVRQFGLEVLQEQGAVESTHALHLRHFADLVERNVMALNSSDRFAWIDRLNLEREDVRAALDWAASHPEGAADGQRLAGAMFPYWNFTGRFQEARAWLELAVPWCDAPTLARARAMHGLGTVRFMQGLPEDRQMLEAAAAACRELAAAGSVDERERLHLLGLVLCTLAITRERAGLHPEAVEAARESVAVFEQIDGAWGRALALNDLGRVLFYVGQVEESDTRLQESLAAWRQLQDPWGISLALTTQAITRCHRGHTGIARRAVEEALLLQVRHDDAWGQANSHACLGTVAERDDDLPLARDRYLDSIQRNVLLGRFASAAFALVRVARVVDRMGDATAAALLLGRCLVIQETTGARLGPEQAMLEELRADLGRRLGSASLDELLAQGRALPVDDLAEFVTASTERLRVPSA